MADFGVDAAAATSSSTMVSELPPRKAIMDEAGPPTRTLWQDLATKASEEFRHRESIEARAMVLLQNFIGEIYCDVLLFF